jgi:type IV fimbrial biogenesis protein FimT
MLVRAVMNSRLSSSGDRISRVASRRVSPQQAESGFTLIELMVTLFVAAILASLGAANYRPFIASQRIRAASQDIFYTLTVARSEAVTRNGLVTAAPVGGDWTAGWTVTAADGTVLSKQNTGLAGLTVTCKLAGSVVPCPAAGIVFGGNGRLAAPAAAVQISSSSTPIVRCIGVDLSGKSVATASSC